MQSAAEIDYDIFQGHAVNGLTYTTTGAATGYNTNGGVTTNIPIFGGNIYTIGDPITMTVSYNSLTNVLSWSGTDAGKSLTFSQSQANVNLASITGGTAGFIGFTGANGYNDSTQTITNFNYFGTVANGNLPSTTALYISSSGALDLVGVSQTVGDLSGAGVVTNSFPMTISTLTTGGDGSSQTFSGRLKDGAGAIALTLDGGTLTLSGTSNSYSAGTFVEDGTLIATNTGAIADGTNLTVGDAGQFPAPVIPAAAINGGQSAAAPPVSPVPEPGALALLAAAVCGTAVARQIRRGKCRAG